MKIEKIKVFNEGYVHCHSCFYSSQDNLSVDLKYCFNTGINRLYGEIDSGVWAISYLLSMYSYRPQDFILFEETEAIVNGTIMSLENLSQYSCYMDRLNPLFATKNSVKKLIIKGIRDNKLNYFPHDIKKLFRIDSERFEQPITSVGNEIFKVMAAIGYCYKKEIFCFPWLSQKRFENYHSNITDLLEILASLNKIIILPIGELH